MFHTQSTYLLKLTVRRSLLYFFLLPFERPLSGVLLYCTSSLVFTLLAFALERISLFIFSISIIRIPR